MHQSIDGNAKGHPMQRAMFLEFLGDRTTHYLDRQFMLGPSLLVAPVFVPDGEESEYYLPAGRWTSFFHPERTLVGPPWVKEVVPMDEIPVWVRPGSVLALGPAGTGRPDYEYAKSVSLLSEVMERVMRGEDSTENPRRANGRRRSVVAQEEEVRRLKSIVSTMPS